LDYHSAANIEMLERRGLKPEFQRAKPRGKPMPRHIARGNARRARIRTRTRVEHVFAAQKRRFDLVIRTIGKARATAKLRYARRASSPPSWGWSPTSNRVAERTGSAAFPNAVTATSDGFSSTAPGRYWSDLGAANRRSRTGSRLSLHVGPTNVVLVAMANKTARVVWAMLSRHQDYMPDRLPAGLYPRIPSRPAANRRRMQRPGR
jgi:hypothetical protein